MGAGASTGTEAIAVAAKPKVPGKKAKELFQLVDSEKDGKLSAAEIRKAFKSDKSLNDWTDGRIDAVIEQFDKDGDGQLNLAEFHAFLAEVKAKGGLESIGASAVKAQAEPDPSHLTAWETYKDRSSDQFERKHMAKLIRDINDREGLWDDNTFGPYVKTQYELLCGSEDKKVIGTKEQFLVWYPGFHGKVQAMLAEREAAWQAEKEAKAANSGGVPGGAEGGARYEGAIWECPMSQLQKALLQAWNVGKTPLLIDCTTAEGEDRGSGFSPLEVFYSYSGEGLIELKKAVVEVGMKKTKTVEQVQAEFAKVLLMCLKQGRMLTLLCSTSAPPMTSKFAANCPHFPLDILDCEKVKPVVGDEGVINGSWVERVVTWSQGEGLHTNPSYGPIIQVHKDFRVVVVTKFAIEDYADFLGSEWPLEKMQPMRVFAES